MNQFEQRSRDSYNKKAENYDNTTDGRFTAAFKSALVQQIDIASGCVLLDIACGNGRLLKTFSKKATFHGVGVDISEKMIQQAQRLNPTMTFHVSGCDSLPLPDNHCDIATVCAAFHHFPAVHAFACEVHRVMKPGGNLYVAEIYLPALLRHLCNPFLRFSSAGDVRFYAPDEIANIFKAHGFCKTSVTLQKTVQVVALQKE